MMKEDMKSLVKSEKGNITILFAVSMIFMLGILGLVFDLGLVYKEKSDLKKMATTAALSGAQELPNKDPLHVQNVVNHILASYQAEGTLETLDIELEKNVRVALQKEVPFAFARIFGLNSLTIKENAAASLFPIGQMKGVVPLGIKETSTINYGDKVTLKVGPGDSESGNFGILALEGKGAKSYGETLKFGSELPISIGDSLLVQTGNIEGATRDGVNYRMAQCPNPNGDTSVRECARILPVVVYKPIDSKTVKVTGFAFFYLEPPGSDPSIISGKFIKRVDLGTYLAGSLNRGAYMSRLIE
jgi:hypothetical protein